MNPKSAELTNEEAKPVSFEFIMKDLMHHKSEEISAKLIALWSRHVAITKELKVDLRPPTITISVNVPSTRALDTIAATFIRNCLNKGVKIEKSAVISFPCNV